MTLWIAVSFCGLAAMLKYERTAGEEGSPPGKARIPISGDADSKKFHLVMFAHPRCPCTRASLGELAILMTRCAGNVDSKVYFFVPRGAGDEWRETDNWRSAGAIPSVDTVADEGGIQASRLGAKTSGVVFLYAPDGSLMFRGGITEGRGHSGDNPGRDAIIELIQTGHSSIDHAPVYGCSLIDSPLEGLPQ